MRTLIATSSLALAVAVSGGPAPAQQRPWTLRECIDYAIENNIQVKQYEVSVEESEVSLRNARNSRLPNLTAGIGQNFSFGRFLYEDVEEEVNKYINSQTSQSSLSVSTQINLYQGRAITNNIKAGRLDLKAEIAGLESIRENIELQVTSYYLEVLYRKELLKVYRQELELSRQQLERAEILVETGMSPRTELLETRSQVARNTVRVTNAEGDVETAILDLQQALNLTIGTDTWFDIAEPRTDDVPVDANLLADPYTVYQQALVIKPHIREQEYRLESSLFRVRAARGGLFPSISLGASYGNSYSYIFGASGNAAFINQVKERGSESVGINISIPIYNRGTTRNNIRLAQLNVRSRELYLENMKLSIYKDIQQAHRSLLNAIAEHTATETAVEASRESYRLTEESFSLGRATAIELSESRSNLIASLSDRVRARYEYVFRSKIIDFYKGIPISL
ncbi:MAG: TolC family protein [Rikenellaceae bacterium]|nr:TolC family protein [Rikenellaceae bacterium]